jgi:endonuclease III
MMAKADEKKLVQLLMERHGKTFSEEIGITVEKNTPSALFQLLCAALLFSARIRSDIAVEAAKAIKKQGWTTPEKMAQAKWEDRVRTLNQAGYARYDERTSTMLGETSDLLLERYGGDLRKLREKAESKPSKERSLLKEFKGIGDVGVDIFFREAQTAWDELFPFADSRALDTASILGLPKKAGDLAKLVKKDEFPRLVAALVRARLQGEIDALQEENNA